MISNRRTRSRNVLVRSSRTNLERTLVLSQFNRPQMIAHIARFCTRQYFAVLALLRAASHRSRFRIAIRNTYRQWLQHEFHTALMLILLCVSNDYLKARESTSRAIIKCISRCVILPIFETWAPSSCNIYRRSYSNACTATTSNTSWTNFRNRKQIRRFDVATSTTISSGSTHIDGPASKIKEYLYLYTITNISIRRQSIESSDKRTSFRVTHSKLSVLRRGHSAYEAISQRWHGHKSAERGVSNSSKNTTLRVFAQQ